MMTSLLTKVVGLPNGGMILIDETGDWFNVVERTGNPANPPYVHESCETRDEAIRTARQYARERSADIREELRAQECDDIRQAISEALEQIESPAKLRGILETINRRIGR